MKLLEKPSFSSIIVTVNHPKIRVPTLVQGDSELLFDLGSILITNYNEKKSMRLD